MKKWLLSIIGIILILSGTAIAGGPSFSGGGSGGAVITASDCDVAAYYAIGKLCQDTDDGKLYKGTGAAVVEIAAGSSGDVTAVTKDITWGDGTGPSVFTFSVTGTDPTITATASKIAIGGTLDLGSNNLTTTGSLGATGAGKLTKGWFIDLESTNMPTVNGTAIDSTFMPIGWISRAGTNNVLTYTGNYSLGLTLSNNTAVTLPTSGTLATTAFKPSDLSITDQAAGDVLYFNGTNWVRLAADAGKYLKSGASAVSWDTPVGGGTVDISGTPANHYWTSWTDDNTVKGTAITSSKPVCSDASGDPAVCAGTEGVWQTAITFGTGTETALASAPDASGGLLSVAGLGSVTQAYNATLTALAAQTESQGALQYYTADATPAVLAKGTAYQLLQMNSGATAPEWTSLLSISALNLTSATSSIPWVVGTASAPTTEGQAYWNSSTDTLTVGNGSTATALASTTYKPADLAIASQSAGDVLYFDGTNWVRLAADAGKYLKSGASAVSWDTPAGTGDFKADGSVPFTAALVPNAANTVALGSTSAEIADIYLGDGAIIYGQNDQSNTITSSATGWSFAKPITIADASNDNYIKVTNNTSRAATASVNEIYPEGNIWKVNQNGTESSLPIGPTAGQITFSGPTQARTVTLPDAAVTIPANPIGGTLGATTNVIPKASGTGTATLQASGITEDGTSVAIGALNLTSSGYIALGTDPADAGSIRLPNAGYIYSEADATGTDISVIGVDSGEVVQIGASGASGVTITPNTTITGDLTVTGSDISLGAAGVKLTGDGDGALTILGLGDGSDEDLTINLDDTANTAVVSSSTGVTKIDYGSIGSATTGIVSGGTQTPVIGDADDFDNNFTGANLYGGTYIVNAAGTVVLPAVAAGMNFTIVLEGAVATPIDPDGTGTADTIYMNGLAAASDENITSSTRGAMCVFQYRAADTWMATCNGFTEATPP